MTSEELKAWAEQHANEMDGSGEYPTEEGLLAEAILALFAERDAAIGRSDFQQACCADLPHPGKACCNLEDAPNEDPQYRNIPECAFCLRVRAEAAEARLAEVERDRDEARVLVASEGTSANKYAGLLAGTSYKLKTAEARVEALEKALLEYGRHSTHCRFWAVGGDICDCGWEKARAALAGKEGP